MNAPRSGWLLRDAPQNGAWNMALDEALWLGLTADAQPILRLYEWDRPTLSLGYFQSAAARAAHPASAACPLVRRMSGGGALVHDREQTYSLILPRVHPLARDTAGLYRVVHECWIAALARQGVPLEFYAAAAGRLGGDRTAAGDRTPAEPFLCFARREEFDLVLHGAKVVGSAQRRSKFGVVQHGSLIWSRSPAAPELWGVHDLGGPNVSEESAVREWVELLGERLEVAWQPTPPPPETLQQAAELARLKYGASTWNERR